jgi:hypothetical protein
MTARMTEAELFALPVTVDIPTAGRAWGLNRSTAYELAKAGQFPCRVEPLKGRYVVLKPDLMRALGYAVPEMPAVENAA